MRFLAAPWLALLADEVWLKNARQANEAALKLASGLGNCGAEIVFPVESNAVFSRLDVTVAREPTRARMGFLQIHRAGHLSFDVCVVGNGGGDFSVPFRFQGSEKLRVRSALI